MKKRVIGIAAFLLVPAVLNVVRYKIIVDTIMTMQPDEAAGPQFAVGMAIMADMLFSAVLFCPLIIMFWQTSFSEIRHRKAILWIGIVAVIWPILLLMFRIVQTAIRALIW